MALAALAGEHPDDPQPAGERRALDPAPAAPFRRHRRAGRARRREPAARRADRGPRRPGRRRWTRSARLIGARGRVLPMACEPLDIEAEVTGLGRRPARRPPHPRPGRRRVDPGPGAPRPAAARAAAACPRPWPRCGPRTCSCSARAPGSPACCRTCCCPSCATRSSQPGAAGGRAQPGSRAGGDGRVLAGAAPGRARRARPGPAGGRRPRGRRLRAAAGPVAPGRRGCSLRAGGCTWRRSPRRTRRRLGTTRGPRGRAGRRLAIRGPIRADRRRRRNRGATPDVTIGGTHGGSAASWGGGAARGDDRGGEGRAERLAVSKPCCRRAEVAALLRFAGGLHIVGGRVVVEAELDTGSVARRLAATSTSCTATCARPT